MTSTRIAVIGVGHLGKIHARLLKSIAGFELLAVVDSKAAIREAVAAEHRVASFADFKTLEGKIDAAVIATPTTFHLEACLWCLEHGIHCLVEKPLVRTARHADILVQIARHRDLTLQVGHVERFNPAWRAVKPLINQVAYVESHRASSYSGRSTDIGAVFDLMIHDLDLVLDCVDSPIASVSASGQSLLGEHEDWAEARLDFQNGAVANLFASRVSRHAMRRMKIVAQGLSAELDFAASTCDVIEESEEIQQGTLQAEKLPEEERRALHANLFERYLPVRSLEAKPINAIEMELIDFRDSIVNRRSPLVSGKSARSVVAIAERILEALEESANRRRQAREAEDIPSIIPAAHRFGARRAS